MGWLLVLTPIDLVHIIFRVITGCATTTSVSQEFLENQSLFLR